MKYIFGIIIVAAFLFCVFGPKALRSLRLIIFGIIAMTNSVVMIIQGRYPSWSHGTPEIITPQDNPAAFWGPCLTCFLVGFAFFAVGIYRVGKNNEPSNRVINTDSRFSRRMSLPLIIWGIIFLGCGVIVLSQGRIAMTLNGVREIVSPQNHPGAFWEISLGFLLAGMVLCAVGVFLMVKNR